MAREDIGVNEQFDFCGGLVDPKLVSACAQVVDYIVQQDQLEFLTTAEVTTFLNNKLNEHETLEILYFLTSPAIDLLELQFELLEEEGIDSDGYESGPTITPDQLKAAYEYGALVHPNSGKLIKDFTSYLVPFFRAGHKLSEARKNAF